MRDVCNHLLPPQGITAVIRLIASAKNAFFSIYKNWKTQNSANRKNRKLAEYSLNFAKYTISKHLSCIHDITILNKLNDMYTE